MAIELFGVLSEQDIAAIKTRFNAMLESHEEFGLYIDMSELNDMTADAIVADLKFELSAMKDHHRIRRIAFITDKHWVSAVVTMFQPFCPQVTCHCFPPSEHTRAMEFASQLPEPSKLNATDTPPVARIATDRDDLIAFECIGRMRLEDLPIVLEPLSEAFRSDQKIDLLVRLTDFAGFAPVLLMENSIYAMKFAALSHVRKYAVVGAPIWLRRAAELFKPMIDIDMRFFHADEEDAAWDWLKVTAVPTNH
ncbi:STAS/SEC14 domain-containing protein [Stieleria magnilauensis]|uniref:STAS/SEC14 domain-containing protein n=1 Tax=Stieleria magnilauensis TaxID=2527963 RepID=A0ABX5XUV7_9BACT|nr:hypothetical protein TBK1r_48310 [Planctomycetes bacterium TBK1r]